MDRRNYDSTFDVRFLDYTNRQVPSRGCLGGGSLLVDVLLVLAESVESILRITSPKLLGGLLGSRSPSMASKLV